MFHICLNQCILIVKLVHILQLVDKKLYKFRKMAQGHCFQNGYVQK